MKQPAQLQPSLLHQLSRFWSFFSLCLGWIYRVLITSIFYLLYTVFMQKQMLEGGQRAASWACWNGKQHLPAWHWAQESKVGAGGARKGETEFITPGNLRFVWFPFIRMIPLHAGITDSWEGVVLMEIHAYKSANQPQELLPITTSKIQVSRGLRSKPSSYTEMHFKHFWRLFRKIYGYSKEYFYRTLQASV